MAGAFVIPKDDRQPGRTRRLQPRGHLARLERRHPRIQVALRQHHRRVVHSVAHRLVGRIPAQELELLRLLRVPVLEERRQVVRLAEGEEAHQVQVRETAEHRAEEIRPLRERARHQQPAVARSGDRQPSRIRDAVFDEPLGGGEEVVEDLLLVPEHPGAVPLLPVLSAAAKRRYGIDAAGLRPDRGLGPEGRGEAHIETAVAVEQRRRFAVRLDIAPPQERHRRPRAVGRGVEHLLDDEVPAVVVRTRGFDEFAFVGLEVEPVARLRRSERTEREHRGVLAVAGALQRRGMERRERHFADRAQRRSALRVLLVHDDPRRRIGEVVRVGPSADGRVPRQPLLPFRDPFRPPRAVGPSLRRGAFHRRGEHPVVRGVPVGMEQQPSVRVSRRHMGVFAGEHRMDGAARPLQQEDLVPRPAVLRADEQPLAAADLFHPQEGLRAVALAEEFPRLAGSVPDPVVAHPRPDLPRPMDGVEALAFAVERDRSVERLRQRVGPHLAGAQVEQVDADLVEPAVPDAEQQQRTVRRHIHDVHAGGVVVTEGGGVHEDLVVTVRRRPGRADGFRALLGSGAGDDPRLRLARPAQGEDLPVPGAPGRPHRRRVHQPGEPGLQPRGERRVGGHLPGVGVLRRDPGAGLRAVLFLEPPVGIGDIHAVEGVHHHFHPRRRRRRPALPAATGEDRRHGERREQRREPAPPPAEGRRRSRAAGRRSTCRPAFRRGCAGSSNPAHRSLLRGVVGRSAAKAPRLFSPGCFAPPPPTCRFACPKTSSSIPTGASRSTGAWSLRTGPTGTAT